MHDSCNTCVSCAHWIDSNSCCRVRSARQFDHTSTMCSCRLIFFPMINMFGSSQWIDEFVPLVYLDVDDTLYFAYLLSTYVGANSNNDVAHDANMDDSGNLLRVLLLLLLIDAEIWHAEWHLLQTVDMMHTTRCKPSLLYSTFSIQQCSNMHECVWTSWCCVQTLLIVVLNLPMAHLPLPQGNPHLPPCLLLQLLLPDIADICNKKKIYMLKW